MSHPGTSYDFCALIGFVCEAACWGMLGYETGLSKSANPPLFQVPILSSSLHVHSCFRNWLYFVRDVHRTFCLGVQPLRHLYREPSVLNHLQWLLG